MNVIDVQFNGTSIGASKSSYNSGKQMIVDSGTTDSFFPHSVQAAFKEVFNQVSGKTYVPAGDVGECAGYTKDEIATFPRMQIIVEGKSSRTLFNIL